MTPQELKNSILQLAIQGKLVEQRPDEGSAEELLKKIEKYTRHNKPCKDELNYSAMDFDIPDSWKTVEMNQIFDFVDYRGKTPKKISRGVFLVTASNIKPGYMDYTRKEYISEEEYELRQSRGITELGDLLFTTEAPMGNAAICDLERCSCGQRIITFKPYENNTVWQKLFMLFILSPQFQTQLRDNCTGTTAKGIKAEKLKHFHIPFPPFAEQKRIVARIEELMPLVDRYEQAWTKLEAFNKKFPVDMQKSILQMAIQGKLVEQRPGEGTGEELYKQIQAEKQKLIIEGKIKKEKPLPEITDDEKPFDIPENWKWVNIEQITYPVGNKSNQILASEVKKNGALPAVSQSASLIDGYSDDVGKAIYDLPVVLFGDHTRIVKLIDFPFIVSADGTKLMKCIIANDKYIYYLLTFVSEKLRNRGYARHYSLLKKEYLPLPPLAEQKRIVAKIEELVPYCELLKS